MIDLNEIKVKQRNPAFRSFLQSDLVSVIGIDNLPLIGKNYIITKFTVYDNEEQTPPFTPTALIKEITDKLIGGIDFSTAKFLVIYTVEWANYLQAIHGVPAENITVVGDSKRFEVSTYQGYNFITADDFLAEDFNKEDELKFDVVIGNPPYQETLSDGSRKDQASNLWSKFWKKSLIQSKIRGIVSLITPTSWLSPSSDFKGESKLGDHTRLWDVFMGYDTYADVRNVSAHFQGVGSTFGYAIVNKSGKGGLKFSDGADISLGFLPKSDIQQVINSLSLVENLDKHFKVNQDNTPDLRVSIPLTRTVEPDNIEILDGVSAPTKGSDKEGLYLYVHVDTIENAEKVRNRIIECIEILNVHCRWNGFMNIKTVKMISFKI